jgi:AcrR family transcriptional regulator
MRADARKNYDHLLTVAREIIARDGAGASMRDVARQAGVGFGTMYRHFPTREALLEALLRTGFDAMTARADELEASSAVDEALVDWLRETVAAAHSYSGVTAAMMVAIEDPQSALHASCVAMRSAGARLLARAQAKGVARRDIDGADLFALIGALAWLADQPGLAPRANHLSSIIADAILPERAALKVGTPA